LFAEALGVQGDAFDPREPDGLVIELPGAMEASQCSLPRPTIRYEAWPIDPPVQFVGRRRPSQAKAQTSERAHRVRVGLIVRAMSGGGYRALLGDAVRDLTAGCPHLGFSSQRNRSSCDLAPVGSWLHLATAALGSR